MKIRDTRGRGGWWTTKNTVQREESKDRSERREIPGILYRRRKTISLKLCSVSLSSTESFVFFFSLFFFWLNWRLNSRGDVTLCDRARLLISPKYASRFYRVCGIGLYLGIKYYNSAVRSVFCATKGVSGREDLSWDTILVFLFFFFLFFPLESDLCENFCSCVGSGLCISREL